MSKRKTLKKPVRSLDDMPTLKAKDKTQFIEFRASKRIGNKKYVSKALKYMCCLVILSRSSNVPFTRVVKIFDLYYLVFHSG